MIIPDREAFILTNLRTVYVVSNTVMGGWSSEWEYQYGEIQGPPPVENEGTKWYITINPKVRMTQRRALFRQ
jgi:hypothetical protein